MYVEIQSAKGDANRSELIRIIEDCKNGSLDVVVFQSVSLLGRDTIETIEAYMTIHKIGVRIIFD